MTIRFGTDGWRAIIADTFTVDNVLRVADATAQWILETQPHPSVVIGYDCRFGGAMFAEWTARMMARRGVKVWLSKTIVSTPMVSLAVQKQKAGAGVVITASHNPPLYNGFKIKGWFGGPALPEMIAEVEKRIPAETGRNLPELEQLLHEGSVEYLDLEAIYRRHIAEHFTLADIQNGPLRFAYDAMYGAGQFVMKKLLPELTCYRCSVNPGFNGTPPEPVPAYVAPFLQYLKEHPADAALITDGDADRVAMTTGDGRFVDSHHIILLLLLYYVKYQGRRGKVAVSFSCSHKIEQFCRKYDLPFEYTKIGFKYLVPYLLDEKQNCLIAAEESGGIAVSTHIPERDGIWIGLMLWDFMVQQNKTLAELIEEVYAEVGRFFFHRESLHLKEAEKTAVIKALQEGRLTEVAGRPVVKTEDLDGYKLWLADDTWVMIRPSGTEPVLRIYAESPDADTTFALLKALSQTLRELA